jgi:hypothetical protein
MTLSGQVGRSFCVPGFGVLVCERMFHICDLLLPTLRKNVARTSRRTRTVSWPGTGFHVHWVTVSFDPTEFLWVTF